MGLLHDILRPEANTWLAGFRPVHCSHPDCRRWLTHRALETRRAGVRMEESWFCSWMCLAPVLAERLVELAGSESGTGTYASRMPLGMVLVQQGRLTYEQFREAEAFADEELGEAVVRLGFCEERHVLAARAVQWGCPVFTPMQRPQVIAVPLPMTLLRRYGMVPVHFVASTRSLLMGFVHRIEYSALFALEQVTGCKTQASFISPAEFAVRMELQEAYSAEVVMETAETPHAMAAKIASHGMEMGADEVVLVRAPHDLWVRLKDGERVLDVLFRV